MKSIQGKVSERAGYLAAFTFQQGKLVSWERGIPASSVDILALCMGSNSIIIYCILSAHCVSVQGTVVAQYTLTSHSKQYSDSQYIEMCSTAGNYTNYPHCNLTY